MELINALAHFATVTIIVNPKMRKQKVVLRIPVGVATTHLARKFLLGCQRLRKIKRASVKAVFL